MAEKEREYHTVSIPKSLALRIKKLVAGRLGYMSVADYVREAVREKLQRDESKLEYEELKESTKKEKDFDDFM